MTTAPKPAATQSDAGQPAGAPCATCQQKPPPPQPPCDFDQVELRCEHCGTEDRAIAGVSFSLDPASGQRSSTQVRPTNPRRPLVADRFEVVGPDELTITITGGPGFGPDHPLVLLTPPAKIGPPSARRGPSQTLKVTYEPKWFETRLANAGNLPFAASLRQFFFPPPAVYSLEILACGARPVGQKHGFSRFTHAIAVYPDDTFALSLSLPSLRKRERSSSGYTEGAVTGTTRSSGTSSGLGRTSESTKVETRETASSYLYRQTDAAANKLDSVTQTQTLATLRGRDLSGNQIELGDAPDHAALATAKSFKISRKSQDITLSFKFADFIGTILKLRKLVLGVIEFFRQIAARSPKIGWSVSIEVEILSGSLSYEWGYKEFKKDHTVYRYYKIEVAMTVYSAKAELAFGVELLGAKAQVYGSLAGELKLSASREADPDKTGPAASVSAAPSVTGEIGVRGALGDWVELVGKITGSFEGGTTIELAPFSWKAKIGLSEGKGSFVVRSKLWFDTEGEAKLWDPVPIWSGTLIG